MGGINHIKLLSANKGLLKKAEHNLTTYSELTPQKNISKVHFFVRHPVYSFSVVVLDLNQTKYNFSKNKQNQTIGLLTLLGTMYFQNYLALGA